MVIPIFYYEWHDKFFEGCKKVLINSSGSTMPKTDQAKIAEFEKV